MEGLAVAASVLIAIAGLLFERAKDRANRRREVVTAELLVAYRRLACPSEALDDTARREIARALNDLQVIGSPVLVQMAHDAVADESGFHDLAPASGALRDQIRAELGLPPVDVAFRHFRI